jgi:hypothetical protein
MLCNAFGVNDLRRTMIDSDTWSYGVNPMTTVAERITQVDDATAVRLLTIVTDTLQRQEPAYSTESTDDVRNAVAEFADSEQTTLPATVSDGDLARGALLVLAEDEDQAQRIQTLLDGPSTESYVGVGLVLAVGAVLIALQTRVKFVVKDGKKQLEITKPSLSGKHLVELARQFTTWCLGKPN